MEANCQRETEELHLFFEDWLTGACDENLTRCDKALGKDFEIVRPDGTRLKKHDLLEMLREQFGQHASLEIKIDDFNARVVGEGLCLATYKESHKTDEDTRVRLSTALFRARSDAPHGVEWAHVHETWLADPESA